MTKPLTQPSHTQYDDYHFNNLIFCYFDPKQDQTVVEIQ